NRYNPMSRESGPRKDVCDAGTDAGSGFWVVPRYRPCSCPATTIAATSHSIRTIARIYASRCLQSIAWLNAPNYSDRPIIADPTGDALDQPEPEYFPRVANFRISRLYPGQFASNTTESNHAAAECLSAGDPVSSHQSSCIRFDAL